MALTALRELFPDGISPRLRDEVCQWHMAISHGEGDRHLFVLDVTRGDVVEEVSRRRTVGIVDRVHRRLMIHRGHHDTLPYCIDCWQEHHDDPYEDGYEYGSMYDYDRTHSRDPDHPFGRMWYFCSHGGCRGIPDDEVTDWVACWMDLITEESRDASGRIVLHHVESWVDLFGPRHHWCKLPEDVVPHNFRYRWDQDRFEADEYLLEYDDEELDHLRSDRVGVLHEWWLTAQGGEGSVAAWKERKAALEAEAKMAAEQQRIAMVRRQRRELVERRREEYRRRFGVPWNVHARMQLEGVLEWDE